MNITWACISPLRCFPTVRSPMKRTSSSFSSRVACGNLVSSQTARYPRWNNPLFFFNIWMICFFKIWMKFEVNYITGCLLRYRGSQIEKHILDEFIFNRDVEISMVRIQQNSFFFCGKAHNSNAECNCDDKTIGFCDLKSLSPRKIWMILTSKQIYNSHSQVIIFKKEQFGFSV